MIDSRQFTNTINVRNVECFEEQEKDQRLSLVYFIPDPKHENAKEAKYLRKQEIYECCENGLVIRTFKGIEKRIIEQMGSKEALVEHLSFLNVNCSSVKTKDKA